METVSYAYQFNYPSDSNGNPFPILQLRVFNPSDREKGLDIEGYLDSGAEYSLLNGWIARSIGLDLLTGTKRNYSPARGDPIVGRVHRVTFSHPTLGNFEIEIGFSTEPIRREILGRDFFSQIQIGFREKQLSYYITPAP